MGGEGFANPFTNNIGTMVRQALQSVNFVAGVSGWQITRVGNAEFNNATIRGELDVGTSPNPRVIVTTSIPATLVAASTDFDWVAGVFKWYNATDYEFEVIGYYNVPSFHASTIVGVGAYSVGLGSVNFDFFRQNAGVGQTLLYGSDVYNATSLNWTYRNGFFSTSSTVTNTMNALDTYIGASFENWHAMVLQNGWGNFGGAFVTANYRKVASPPRCAEIVGVISGGVNAAGTIITNLPAAYRPITQQRALTYAFGAGMNIATETPAIDIKTNGDVTLNGTVNAAILSLRAIYNLDI